MMFGITVSQRMGRFFTLLRKNYRNFKFWIKCVIKEKLVKIAPIKECLKGFEEIKHPIVSKKVETHEIASMPIIESALRFKNLSYKMPPLFTAVINNLNYCSDDNILITRNGTIVKESINSVTNKARFKISSLYFLRREFVNGYCTLFRSVSNEFYHVLIDNLPRLYALQYEPYNKISEIKLLVDGELTEIEKYFLAKLLPLNVVVTSVKRHRLYKIEKTIFLPFLTQQYAGYLPENYVQFFVNRVAPNRPRNKKNRIYISRDKAEKRRIVNEAELFDRLSELGFEKYVLEDISFDDQIELFYDAEAVVSPHGAGLTNIIYADKISVFEIFPQQRIKPSYYFLGLPCGHKYYFFNSMKCMPETEFRKMNNVDFEVDSKKICDKVSNVIGSPCNLGFQQ